MTRRAPMFWKIVRLRPACFAAMLLALVAAAPVPDPLCRLECDAAASRAIPERAEACHSNASQERSESRSSRPCSRHARVCALPVAADAALLAPRASGREAAAALATSAASIRAGCLVSETPRAPTLFASPPSGTFSSVLRL